MQFEVQLKKEISKLSYPVIPWGDERLDQSR